MRKIDKYINLKKANLMLESEYLKGKTIIKELDTDTYGRLMNKTSDFPTKKFNNPSDNRKDVGNQYDRINKSANEGFVNSFLKRYNGTTIMTNSGEFTFKDVVIKTNHISYSLIFQGIYGGDGSPITIKIDKDGSNPDGFYIDNKKIKISDEYKETVNKLLSHQKNHL